MGRSPTLYIIMNSMDTVGDMVFGFFFMLLVSFLSQENEMITDIK